MEAVLPQPIRLGYLLVDGVGMYMFGNSTVERGIEVGDASDIGDVASAGADDFQGREVVSAIISIYKT